MELLQSVEEGPKQRAAIDVMQEDFMSGRVFDIFIV